MDSLIIIVSTVFAILACLWAIKIIFAWCLTREPRESRQVRPCLRSKMAVDVDSQPAAVRRPLAEARESIV